METSWSCEVAVVGAGFAGLRAAADLHAAGVDVRLLEARDRVGGRTWTGTLGAAAVPVELGGGFFVEAHHRVQALMAENGATTRTLLAPQRWSWRVADGLRTTLPVGPEQWPELERLAVQLARDAEDEEAGALNLDAWCTHRSVSAPLRDALRAAWSITAGAAPDHAAMVDLFDSLEEHGGLTGLLDMVRRTPDCGFSALAERLADGLGERLVCSCPVTGIQAADDRSVRVATAAGGAGHARLVVLAVPVNVLGSLGLLEPGAAVTPSAGASLKLLVQLAGVGGQSAAGGRGRGIDLLLPDRRLDDGTLVMIGFGPRADWPPVIADDDVDAAVRALLPDARLVAWTCHDWVDDPFARGTWLATPAGATVVVALPAALGGRVLLAGSDVARESAGWIEGALASGEQAARTATGLLERQARP